MVCTREQLGGAAIGDTAFRGGGFPGGSFGGGGFGGGGGRSPLVADEETLQAVADETGGLFYRAEDTEQLQQVFSDLPKDVVIQKEELEISAVFAAIGALFAAAAIVASIRFSPYPA
jgi:Ca-activated chloride channel family protein